MLLIGVYSASGSKCFALESTKLEHSVHISQGKAAAFVRSLFMMATEFYCSYSNIFLNNSADFFPSMGGAVLCCHVLLHNLLCPHKNTRDIVRSVYNKPYHVCVCPCFRLWVARLMGFCHTLFFFSAFGLEWKYPAVTAVLSSTCS